MNLLLLAPEIQEEILFLPKTITGHDPLKFRHLQAVAVEVLGEAAGQVEASDTQSISNLHGR